MIGNIFSLSTLSTGVAVFYVYFAFNNLAKLMNPLKQFAAEDLRQMPQEQMVKPFWRGDDAAGTLGLRVYLSTERDFHLNFFTDAEFAEQAETESGFKSVLGQQRSFLLWSEDDAVDSTKKIPARSFVIVASDEMQPQTASSCTLSGEECSASNQAQQTSIEFAHKWLQDSIKHERQLASDGGGLMAAMNSAGGGIESTSVLLAFYSSLTRSFTGIFERVLGLMSSADESSLDVDASGSTSDSEEPLTIINVSPKNPLWRNLMSNGTAYVHVLLARQFPSADEPRMLSASPDARSAMRKLQKIHSHHNLLLDQVGMIKRELPTHVPPPRRLLYRDLMFVAKKCTLCLFREDDSCKVLPPWNIEHHQSVANSEYQMAKTQRKEGIVVPYWKPEVHIHLIRDSESYPMQVADRVGFEIIQVGKGDARHRSGYAYLPSAHVDEIGLTSEKYIPLNETVMALPLRIGFHGGGNSDSPEEQEGITPARYRLLNHLANALESQKEMGFEESDIDDLRRLIAETNVKLLAVTIFASVFHLLFEFLTFKSDVQFWRDNTSLTGLSVRALFLDWISQVVILLYLIELDSSLLMIVPSAVGMLIALWKCQRGAGLRILKRNCEGSASWHLFGYELVATRLREAADRSKTAESSSDKLSVLTEEMDQLATRLLGKCFLLPCVVSYAIYSLLREPHAGWYSWFITTASSFVYAVGFVLMTPQLFLNYKLKSVAHLPWRVLGYRFVNTFIDDLFAFIIRMPTMARMSCFRDDIVFIIYLYQRYLYPVDQSRPVEGGGDSSTETSETERSKKEKKS